MCIYRERAVAIKREKENELEQEPETDKAYLCELAYETACSIDIDRLLALPIICSY